MQARLLGNYGNLALARAEPKQAFRFYKASHNIFFDLNDSEHIGIAHLQIAESIIAGASDLEEAQSHLDTAETIFIRLGWIEGEGRVYEQCAILNEDLAQRTHEENTKRYYVRMAVENAKRARALFAQIDNQKRLGAVESLIQRLQWKFPTGLTNSGEVA